VTTVAEPRSARITTVLPLLPGFAVAAIWIVWAVRDGGYFPSSWYPAGLLAAGLLLTLAVARPAGAFARAPGGAALLLLAGWTAWNALSLLWSDAPGAGREETNKLLVVLVMAVLMWATPWSLRSVWVLLGAWSGAVTAIAVVDLASFALAARPEAFLLESRYLGPTGYANGTAALGAMAFWPLLALSARPSVPPPLRVAALPAAVVTALWALLPQSRGTMLAGAAVVVVFVAFAPNRVRVLTRLAVVGGALWLCVPSLFEVYTASREGRPLADLADDAVARVALAGVLALAASVVLVLLEARARPSERVVRGLRRAGVAAVVLALVAVCVGAAVSRERIADSVSERWDTFASDASIENTQTGNRLGQVTADKRYDYWRVALDAYRERPVAGIGAGGYEPRYTAEKAYAKHSRYAHDIWLRALSETGVVGLALLVGALAALLVALIRARLRTPEMAVAAAATLCVGFFLQCGLDWLEEVPALLAPAVALPLAVLRAGCTGRPGRAAIPAAVLAIVALLALVPSYLAVRQLARGDELRVTNPRGALAAYGRSADADPLALTPHLRSGFLALRLGDEALARRSFQDALDVHDNWVARFELGLLDAQAGRFGPAEAQIRRAEALNRNDPIVTEALAAVRDGERLDPLEVNRQVLDDPVLAQP
jgi:hypothetical protein